MGIDVHKRDSQICILAEGGELIEERIRPAPERFAAVLGKRPRARIVIEASTDREGVARCVEGLGHEVIVACVLGAYRPAPRLADPQRHGRGRLTVRDTVVRTRTRSISLIRARLRQQASRVPSGSA